MCSCLVWSLGRRGVQAGCTMRAGSAGRQAHGVCNAVCGQLCLPAAGRRLLNWLRGCCRPAASPHSHACCLHANNQS